MSSRWMALILRHHLRGPIPIVSRLITLTRPFQSMIIAHILTSCAIVSGDRRRDMP